MFQLILNGLILALALASHEVDCTTCALIGENLVGELPSANETTTFVRETYIPPQPPRSLPQAVGMASTAGKFTAHNNILPQI